MRSNFETFKNKLFSDYLKDVYVDKRCFSASLYSVSSQLKDLYPNLKRERAEGLGREQFGLAQTAAYALPHAVSAYSHFDKRVYAGICPDEIVLISQTDYVQILAATFNENVTLTHLGGGTYLSSLKGFVIGNLVKLSSQRDFNQNGVYRCTQLQSGQALLTRYAETAVRLNNQLLKEGDLALLFSQTVSAQNGVYRFTKGYFERVGASLYNIATLDKASFGEYEVVLVANAGYASQNGLYHIIQGRLERLPYVEYEHLSVAVNKGTKKNAVYYLERAKNGRFPSESEPKSFLSGNDYLLRSSFKYHFSTSFHFRSACEVEGYHLFGGEHGILLRQAGGTAYQLIDSGLNEDIYRVRFFYGKTYILGTNRLFASSESVVDYHRLLSAHPGETMRDVQMADKDTGVAIGDGAAVYYSFDGWQTLQQVEFYDSTSLNIHTLHIEPLSASEYRVHLFGEAGLYIALYMDCLNRIVDYSIADSTMLETIYGAVPVSGEAGSFYLCGDNGLLGIYTTGDNQFRPFLIEDADEQSLLWGVNLRPFRATGAGKIPIPGNVLLQPSSCRITWAG